MGSQIFELPRFEDKAHFDDKDVAEYARMLEGG